MRSKTYRADTKIAPSKKGSAARNLEDRISWDDLKVAIACAREQSFRKAASSLGVALPTVLRRIERLENVIGRKLFIRHSSGISPSDGASLIMQDLGMMQNATGSLVRRLSAASSETSSYVRLAITDGLGTYWCVPKLIDFNRNSPVKVELHCTNDIMDVARLQADISVQFVQPTAPNVVAVKVGTLHTYPFVSAEYAARFGVPKTIKQALSHRLIQQVSPLIHSDIYAKLFKVKSVDDMVALRTGTSSAVLYAVERGGGMAFLPTYALALGAPLVPVNVGIRNKLDIWLSYHPDFRESERHRRIVAWIRRIFDARRYPCFGDEFIHPSRLATLMKGLVDGDRVMGFAAASLGGRTEASTKRVHKRKAFESLSQEQ